MTVASNVVEVDVGAVDDVPLGEGQAFAVGDRQIAVFRLRDGGWRAVDAVCPHADGPLANGHADERVVVCPLHQRIFDLATGAASAAHEPGLATYPVRVDELGDQIVVTVG